MPEARGESETTKPKDEDARSEGARRQEAREDRVASRDRKDHRKDHVLATKRVEAGKKKSDARRKLTSQ